MSSQDQHQRILPDNFFEPVPGLYSQIIRCADGPRVEIAGTLPYHPDGSLDLDLQDQAKVLLENLDRSLEAGNVRREDIVRMRIFTTRMDDFIYGGTMNIVFEEYFGEHRPTSTLVEVNRLANPHVQIEIDCTAIAQGKSEAPVGF